MKRKYSMFDHEIARGKGILVRFSELEAEALYHGTFVDIFYNLNDVLIDPEFWNRKNYGV